MTQYLHDHLQAGGCDPRCTKTAKSLRGDGVPIGRQTKARSSHSSMARGLFSYIKEEIEKGLTKDERKDECKRLAVKFVTLTDNDKCIYKAGEAMQAEDRCDPAECVDSYSRDIGDKRFGMSSHDEALKHEVAAATVDAMLAGDKSCQTSGMRNYIPRCRDEFSTGVYIASSGSHIISEMYTFDVFACAGFCDVPLEIVIHVLLYVCNYISYALSHE